MPIDSQKLQVAELEGAELDAWVAKAEGIAGLVEHKGRMCWEKEWDPEGRRWDDDMMAWKLWEDYAPSHDWSDGGPIIEREHIEIGSMGAHGWQAAINPLAQDGWALKWLDGPTPLIAAMRAYVSGKFGDEVPLPSPPKD